MIKYKQDGGNLLEHLMSEATRCLATTRDKENWCCPNMTDYTQAIIGPYSIAFTKTRVKSLVIE